MKVLLVTQGKRQYRPRTRRQVAEQLNAEGNDTEVFQLGAKPIRDCIGCGQCGVWRSLHLDDDVVNELIAAAEQADGFGSWSHPSTMRTPADASFRPRSRIFGAAAKRFARTSRAPPSPSPAAAARRPPSTCSTSTSPSTRCLWWLPRTGTTSWRCAGRGRWRCRGSGHHAKHRQTWPGSFRCIEAGKAAGIEAPGSRSRAQPTSFVRTAKHTMNVQIFGLKVLRYKKAQRYFKERRIKAVYRP